jgi:hypothetical protein
MYITLNMKIQDQEFALEANLSNRAGRIYRQQFNRDLLKDMTDLYKKTHKSIFDSADLTGIDLKGKTEQEIYEQILSRVNMAEFIESLNESRTLSFEETDRCGQIVWAFVKNKDINTPNYEEWIDSFDFILPVIDISNALFEAWNKSAQPTIELKN